MPSLFHLKGSTKIAVSALPFIIQNINTT